MKYSYFCKEINVVLLLSALRIANYYHLYLRDQYDDVGGRVYFCLAGTLNLQTAQTLRQPRGIGVLSGYSK